MEAVYLVVLLFGVWGIGYSFIDVYFDRKQRLIDRINNRMEGI